ncbi:hypothetical protein M8494_00050 [Serratia ureilytica]
MNNSSDALWLERNLAENTLASYRLDLQALGTGLASKTPPCCRRRRWICRRFSPSGWTAATRPPAPRVC